MATQWAMAWKIGLNTPHLIVWRRILIGWLAFVGFAVIAGWHLKPRIDELLFAVTLPIWLVVAPYAAYSLLAVVLRSCWPVGFDRLVKLPLFRRNKSLGQDARP